MDLRKLPPSMLLALGLACGDDKGTSDTVVDSGPGTTDTASGTVSVCLDIGPCLSTTGTTPSTSTSTSTSTGPGTDTGTTEGTTASDVSTGPCLSPPEDTTNTDSSSGDTGSGTEGATGTAGMMADQPASRSAAVERVLERGTLPPDVAARLRDAAVKG